MPEIRHYTVTETREVRVQANDIEDACRIAVLAFERSADDQVVPIVVPGVWGNRLGRVKVKSLFAERTS